MLVAGRSRASGWAEKTDAAGSGISVVTRKTTRLMPKSVGIAHSTRRRATRSMGFREYHRLPGEAEDVRRCAPDERQPKPKPKPND
jgi:hypothetical protein